MFLQFFEDFWDFNIPCTIHRYDYGDKSQKHCCIASAFQNRFLTFECTPSKSTEKAKAPSTRIRIFLETLLFIRLGFRIHTETAFQSSKTKLSKTLSRADLFENAVFMLSYGRVKTDLFENAGVTVSIYCISEHALGSGITLNLSVFFHQSSNRQYCCYRISNIECHSVFMWTGIFSKTLLVWTRIFFYMRIKTR